MEKPKMPIQGIEVSDYEDAPFYSLLRQLPRELAIQHLQRIESQSMSDDEAQHYLTEVVAARREASTTSHISDPEIQSLLSEQEQKLYSTLETSVFTNPDNFVGTGTTAKVKYYEVQTNDENRPTIPMAIKYIVSPNSTTLTAEQEHNVIREVDRMRLIEAAELAFPRRSKYIRVPHPYLHHSTDKIQLYGMEYIDGITLEQAYNEGMLHEDMKEALRQSPLAQVPPEELNGYIDRFFETMHMYCLHGDIKPKNVMVSRDGVIYVIDFGQSVMTYNLPSGSQDRHENLKADEVKSVKLMIHNLLLKLLKEETN